MWRRFVRRSGRVAMLGTCYVGVVSYTPEPLMPDALLPARQVNESLWRMGRSFAFVSWVLADYAIAPMFFSNEESLHRRQWSNLHRRNARRCCQLADHNGGLYIKAGQGIASMNNLVPHEYCEELRPLHDGVMKRPLDVVRRAICHAYQVSSISDVFDDFTPTAIAAASIAQVHVATFQGTRVAVKVQHEEVARRFGGDMLTLLGIFRLLRWVAPKYDFVKMLEEVEGYMKAEFDFESEGRYSDMFRNAMEENFKDGSVIVPRVVWAATRPRVLVTEFFEGGFRADDIGAMHSQGIDANQAARLVVDAFAFALFRKGIVHADPHPGNVLIRKRSDNGDPQIAILDFGLTVVTSEAHRKALAELYRASALHDVAALAAIAPHFGRSASASPRELSVLASCTMQEPFDLFSVVSGTSYSHDVDRARAYWETDGALISDILDKCPKEYTMALTNLDMVRALHQDMHATFSRVVATLSFAEQEWQAAVARQGMWAAVMLHVRRYVQRMRRLAESHLVEWLAKRWAASSSASEPAEAMHGPCVGRC